MPSITRKCLEVHNIAPKCLDMLAIAQRTGTTPNRPEASPTHRNHTEPPGSLANAPEPRQNHARTARKSSPDLDDVRIFS